MSSINVGEVYYMLVRHAGPSVADGFWRAVRAGQIPLRLVAASDARVRRAATVKSSFPVSYADAFAMALALELNEPLVTGDKEIRDASSAAGIELHWLGT
jgi:predicted nucleic acid-binding protein